MKQRTWMTMVAAALVGLLAAAAQAVTIDLVPVGNPGNGNNTTGFGGVAYSYQIGKYEITNAQWREFLTAKASASDPYGLYNPDMAGTYGGIDRTWSVDHYVYTPKGGDANWDNRPVNYVSFWDAARFCNWLHNGQANGDTESGAYRNIGDLSTFARQAGAKYAIPTENEWYKAAYHKNDGVTGNYWSYPTGTDSEPNNGNPGGDTGNTANFHAADYTLGAPYYTTPVGYFSQSKSPYGTFDQGGNLWEWNETIFDTSGCVLHGGCWAHEFNVLDGYYRGIYDPTGEFEFFGFRVASVPEPGSITLLVCGAIAGLIWWRRRR
jgi:formylglycine-generating enzyme